jgi:hypothetical protein
MIRHEAAVVTSAALVAALTLSPTPVLAGDAGATAGATLIEGPAPNPVEEATRRPEDPGAPTSSPPARFRIVANGAFWLGSNPSFTENRIFEEYAEETTIRTSYETASAFGPDLAVQVSLLRGLGVRVGYSLSRRDVSGTVEVSRPHPLHFGRHREASAELSGLDYSEGALLLDIAYARSAGHLEWTLFAGVTLFQVEADLLGEPTFTDVYPYDKLAIASTPTVRADARPTGFNVGGGLDYRFGSSGLFGLGLQILYSAADVELQATPQTDIIGFTAGGLQAAAGVRVYF